MEGKKGGLTREKDRGSLTEEKQNQHTTGRERGDLEVPRSKVTKLGSTTGGERMKYKLRVAKEKKRKKDRNTRRRYSNRFSPPARTRRSAAGGGEISEGKGQRMEKSKENPNRDQES